MIRWCCYCQRFLGEVAPYDVPAFTHTICDPCDARLERDEPVMEETEPVRRLVKRLVESAVQGDRAACEAVIAEARALKLGAESLLVGMLQPALYQAGLDWQAARMSVAAEHRLTGWCESVFSALPVAPLSRPLDLLIFQAPGNVHTLGPRIAAHVLAARGLSVEAIVPALPLQEMVEQVQRLRPRSVGFSCALPDAVPAAREVIARLRERLEPQLTCRYVLSGFAFRAGGATSPPPLESGIEVVVALESFRP